MKRTVFLIIILPLTCVNAETPKDAFTQSQHQEKYSIDTQTKPTSKIIKTNLKYINTQNKFNNTIMTRRGANGKLETFCTSNALEAKRFLKGESLRSLVGKKRED